MQNDVHPSLSVARTVLPYTLPHQFGGGGGQHGGLPAPGPIFKIVHVAIAAVEIAATYNLGDVGVERNVESFLR